MSPHKTGTPTQVSRYGCTNPTQSYVRYFANYGDSSVGIATRLRAGRIRFDSRQRQEIFLFSGLHPASYPIGTGGLIPGGRAGEA
jgi:hypothetical protein